MKASRRICLWVTSLVLAAAGPALAAEPAAPAAGADAAAFEQLMSLAGLWAGKVADDSGMDVQVRYEVKPNGNQLAYRLAAG